MSTNLREKIRLQELENEAKKLELELENARQPNKVGFTANEWSQLAITAGGCAVSLPIIGLLVAVLFDPSLVEAYDQFIVGFMGVVIGYYFRDRIKNN